MREPGEYSVVSVALTLVHAVLPKDLWLADRQLEVRWPMWGLPELLQLDNASEFHSRALVRGGQHRSSFDDVTGRTRLPVVTVQMPPAPSERDFYEELLAPT